MPPSTTAIRIASRLSRCQLAARYGGARRYSTPSSPRTVLVTDLPAPHTGAIRVLLLNRPEARNAISKQLLADLKYEIDAIHKEGEGGSTRALVLASAVDSAFCAGADLKERKTFTQEDTANFLASLRALFTSIEQLPIPTISALHAPAFGGGLELALTTHLRLFASTTEVSLPETRLAILPGAGGTYRLPALIGLGRARDLILTGRRVQAGEAYFLGLCDRLVDVVGGEGESKEERLGNARALVLAEAIGLAKEICAGGPIAVRQALKAVNGWQRGEKAENEAYEGVVRTRDRDEALAAFREKRKAVFEGR